MSASPAATPVRTPTPDAVVVPLQYAVALKARRAPARGEVGSTAPRAAAASRESNVETSYRNTKPTTHTKVTSSLRHSDREMIRLIGNARTPRAAPVHLQTFAAPPAALSSRRQSG